MTKLILTIATLLITTYASAQLVIVTPDTQDVTIAWDASLSLDVARYNFYLQHNDGDTVSIGWIGKDVLEYSIHLPYASGTYIIGVSAVDSSDNESEIHFSTDPTAAYGGWYLKYPVQKPSRLRVK